MQLKRQSEIAIAILAVCARRPDTLVRTQDLVEEIGITKVHAYQVISLLARNGFIHAERGRIGGIRLATDAKTKTLAQVLELTEPNIADYESGEEPAPSDGDDSVLLDKLVATADAFFIRLLERFTIADLAAPGAPVPVPCSDCSLLTAERGRERDRTSREHPPHN